ncbi:MAG TPA: 16S rRNA (adenine(1518)-N(6)/adenine(1519)-N(6))-dimethyltransferase RsmA, partial [Tepidisphaeraceae bacterium]|nr:16S rRNA (adenine(1518)-N(6)/adenine(1519)-N(6))-dimethyltransferase RsmA [Tepidisphaeraceae bacterium]
ADAGEISPGDRVIEVGPGTGTLTEEILSRGAHVTAVEIDRDLAKLLRQRFADNPRFALIEGDALASKHALNDQLIAAIRAAAPAPKLVANLPFNIASPLVIESLIAGVTLLAFTVQKEVAQRLRAAAGSEAYGPLSVMAQLLSDVEILRTLPPQAFWPIPKIDSSLVRMIRRDRLGERADPFSRWLHALFSGRRKTLKKAIALAGGDGAAIERASLSPQIRPDELTPEQCLALYEATGVTIRHAE